MGKEKGGLFQIAYEIHGTGGKGLIACVCFFLSHLSAMAGSWVDTSYSLIRLAELCCGSTVIIVSQWIIGFGKFEEYMAAVDKRVRA